MTDSATSSGTRTEEPLQHLMRLIKAKRFDQVEAAWMACLEQEPIDVEGLLRAAQEMVRLKKGAQAGTLLWALIASVREELDADRLRELSRRAALISPGDMSLKAELADLLAAEHEGQPDFASLLEMAGLRDTQTPSDQALAQLDLCVGVRPGRYVYDTQAHRAGRVVEVAPGQGRLTVDLKAYTQKYTAALAAARLELLADDDFRALAVFEKERLQQMAEADPAGLVRLVLQAHGGRLEHRQLKQIVTDADVLPRAWTGWWAKAKGALRRAPDIYMADDAQPYLVLRREAVSYEDEVRAKLRGAAGLSDQIEIVLTYLGHAGTEHPADAGLVAEMASRLLAEAQARAGAAPAEAFVCLAVCAELGRRVPGLPEAPEAVRAAALAAAADPAAWLRAVEMEPAWHACLRFIREHREDWPAIFAAVLPLADFELCDQVASTLAEAQRWDDLRAAVGAVERQPSLYPQAFLWLYDAACRGRYEPVLADKDRAALTVTLIDLSDQVYRSRKRLDDKQARRVLNRMRSVLSAQQYKVVKQVLDHLSHEQAVAIRQALARNDGLDAKVRAALTTHLIRRYGALVTERKELWEDDVIYVTQAGYDRRRAELDHILNVEIPRNQDRIGQAASYGDLSENAEYTAALEERDRLTERVNRLRAELQQMRVLRFEVVPTDRVSVGTRITVRSASGQETQLTFLGPPDADPDRGIYYYRAPFCLAFMGRRPGDQVTVDRPDGQRDTYEILKIEQASGPS